MQMVILWFLLSKLIIKELDGAETFIPVKGVCASLRSYELFLGVLVLSKFAHKRLCHRPRCLILMTIQ